jgi:L-fuculose-phosphate aldolase
VRKKPNTRINAPFRDICGSVGYAPYALPGSEDLGAQIANTFAQGFNSVLLENHGVVTAGGDLLQAFQRFETLEYCAQINIRARALGEYRTLSNEQIDLFYLPDNYLPEFQPERHTSRERELRLQICQFVQRAYERRLMISTSGTVSARVDGYTFLITPSGYDRKYIAPEDVVLICEGQREAGSVPSRSVKMHDLIYRAHPNINSIMTALPPNITTYGAVTRPFETRTIPESYILLRDMPVLPYGLQYQQPEQVAAAISNSTPVILLQNDAVVTTGATILEAFDRIEVAEFSAQSLVQSLNLGELVPISDDEIGNLKQRFSLK